MNYQDYGLDFISNRDFFEHVKETVAKFRSKIGLKEFNKNKIDPIKLVFDSKIYLRSVDDLITHEVARQIDKSNTNHIGYFHQNIFNYIGEGWQIPKKGWDIVNESLGIYVEMKNKHNTMNARSSSDTYRKMQRQLEETPSATCMLVEVISRKSQNVHWNATVDAKPVCNEQIRRVSIDKFYELVTGDATAFRQLCQQLPKALDDAATELQPSAEVADTVKAELGNFSTDRMHSLFLLHRCYERVV